MPNQTMTIDQALRSQQPLSLYQWRALLQELKNQHDLLELLKIDDDVLQNAVLEIFKRQKNTDWQALYEFARENPIAISRSQPTHIDIPLWRIVWQSGVDECRQWVTAILCNYLSRLRPNNSHGALLIDYFAELAATADATLLLAHLNEEYLEGWRDFRPAGAGLLWQLHLPEFDPVILALIATDDLAYHNEQALALTYQIIDSQPDYMLNVKPAKLAPLLIVLDESLIRKAAPQLLQVIGKSAAQNLRETLAARFAQLDPDLLQDLGWLDKKTKNVRLACLDILLQHPQPQALSYLRELYQNGGLDQSSKDRILAHLETKGENIDDLDELAGMSLAELAQQAAQLKKVSKAVEKVDHNALAECLPELEPVLIRWLLHQLATAGDDEDLPRSVRHVIQRCPLEQRQRFVDALVQQWLAYDGDPKMRWLLRLIPYGADDRLVPSLMDAVQRWHKKQKKRAAQAINALAEVDTIFALSQIKAISETRKYTDLLTETAQQSLRQAAGRRQQSLGDLYDELVPDFGLSGDGLDLDVGPYCYRLQLQGDLSLQVIAPNGKITKSLPKLKAQEDPAKHADADATFKRLRKGIKTISEQQAKRMQTALISARTWPVTRWRRLFAEHPLLRQLSQTLIWSHSDKDGNQQGSFRLSEDLSLIDYQDEPVELSEDGQVWLWHPLESEEETINGWREHIQDYALNPAVDQVNRPQLTLKAEWLQDTKIIACQGAQLTQARFTGKMNQWGYRKGSVEDGGYIYHHYLTLPEAGLLVNLNHSEMPAWMELEHIITLEDITVYALDEPTRERYQVEFRQAINPQQLPPVTVSMLLSQLQTLAQLGES